METRYLKSRKIHGFGMKLFSQSVLYSVSFSKGAGNRSPEAGAGELLRKCG